MNPACFRTAQRYNWRLNTTSLLQFSTSCPKQRASTPLPVSWLNHVVPDSLLPYAYLMRLDKPIGKVSCTPKYIKQAEFLPAQSNIPPGIHIVVNSHYCVLCRHLASCLAMLLVHCHCSAFWKPARPALTGLVCYWFHITTGRWLHCQRSLGSRSRSPSGENQEQTTSQRRFVCSSGDRSVSVYVWLLYSTLLVPQCFQAQQCMYC